MESNLTRRGFVRMSTGAAAASLCVADAFSRSAYSADATPLVAGRDLADIVSLDPHRAYEFTFLITDQACYDTLVTFERNNFSKPMPRLARSWQVSSNARQIRFELRPGLRFASGNPVNGDVVKWSFERLRGIQGNPSYLMDPVESMEIQGESTFTIILKQPDATFLSALAAPFFVPVDRDLIKAHGGSNDDKDKAGEWLTEHSAGTGSYEIKSFRRDDRLELEASGKAWAPPSIERVLLRHFGESAALRLALERGDIELIAGGLPSDQIASLRQKPRVAVAEIPSLVFFYVGWTQDATMNKALADPNVGLAIKHAMDYAGYRKLFPASARPAAQVPLGMAGALPAKDGVRYDPAYAKRLLQEAGYPNGFELKISTQTGTHLGYGFSLVAEKVQQDLMKVGIRGQLDIEETSVHLKKMRAGEKEFVVQLTWPDFPDAISFLQWFSPSGTWGKRSRGWKDDQLVQLLDKARATVDGEQRIGIYHQYQRRMIERAPFAVLFQIPHAIPYRDSLKNVYPDLVTIAKPQLISRK